MAAKTLYETRPITVPSLSEAVRLRSKRTGMPEADVARSLGEKVYSRWVAEKRRAGREGAL